MPPTHPSQAAVAAAYRTLIAHETEPKEQDFYRTRLQRLEQATEPECEFDCRSRVAAAGVGVYCPQCSAKCADTDLATELAKAIRAAWVDRLDWDELAHAALKFLTAAGRLVPAGGMALTAEPVEDVRIVLGLNGSQDIKVVLDAQARLRAMFPVPEPAEAATNSMLKLPASDEVSGNNVAECNSSTGGEDVQAKKITRAWMLHLGYSEDHVDSLEQATHEGYGCEHNPFGGWDCIDESGDSQHQDWDEYDNTAQIVMFVLERIPGVTSAELAEEETKAEGPCEVRSPQGDACSFPTPGHAGVHTWAWPDKKPAGEETRAECVGDDYYCAQRDSAGNIRLNCGRGLLVAEAACTVNDVKEWWARADRGSKWERQYQAALDLFDREAASSPVVPAPTEASVIGGAAVALRSAMALLDPHEGGDWEHAWRTIGDLADCASRAYAAAPTETEWQTWQEVPEGVWFLTNQNIGCWMRRDGDKVTTVTGGWPVCTDLLVAQAPFVAAEEG